MNAYIQYIQIRSDFFAKDKLDHGWHERDAKVIRTTVTVFKKFKKSRNIKQYLPTKQHLDRRDRMLYKLDSRRLGTVI